MSQFAVTGQSVFCGRNGGSEASNDVNLLAEDRTVNWVTGCLNYLNWIVTPTDGYWPNVASHSKSKSKLIF